MDRLEILANQFKKERMTSWTGWRSWRTYRKTGHDVMDRVEIVANLLEKRALSFFEGFAIISTLSMTSCPVFTGGGHL